MKKIVDINECKDYLGRAKQKKIILGGKVYYVGVEFLAGLRKYSSFREEKKGIVRCS